MRVVLRLLAGLLMLLAIWMLAFLFYRHFLEAHLPIEQADKIAKWLAVGIAASWSLFINAIGKYTYNLKILQSQPQDSQDGQRVTFTGTVWPEQKEARLLTSPLTRQSCVIYRYSIYHLYHSSGGCPDIHEDWAGTACIPLVIRSDQLSIRLLGCPIELGVAILNWKKVERQRKIRSW